TGFAALNMILPPTPAQPGGSAREKPKLPIACPSAKSADHLLQGLAFIPFMLILQRLLRGHLKLCEVHRKLLRRHRNLRSFHPKLAFDPIEHGLSPIHLSSADSLQ